MSDNTGCPSIDTSTLYEGDFTLKRRPLAPVGDIENRFTGHMLMGNRVGNTGRGRLGSSSREPRAEDKQKKLNKVKA